MIARYLTHSLKVLVVLVLCAPASLRSEVKLHALFSDHMVLQQGMRVPIWGWASEGEKVTVEFQNQKVSAKAKDGRWSVKLGKLEPGGPFTLKVIGNNTVTLQDVLVGEVWIASGQSNMEWPLNRSYQPEAAIAAAANSNLRLFTVPKLKAVAPADNVNAAWKACTPESVPNFSAVGYFFGRDLQKALQVPVGIIHTSWGGSPAEVWMSEKVLAHDAGYKRDIVDAGQSAHQRYQDALAQFKQEKAAAEKEGKPFNKQQPGAPWRPSELYNGMIASIIPYAIQGAIWYQGESNAGRAHQYRSLFADMIENWRADWGQGKFPFLLVQLAPWDKGRKRSLEQITAQPVESDWAELREAQTLSTQHLPKVGMAVITDAGDKDDIHPSKKEPVGQRLALAALGIAYDKNIVYSGPTYKGMKVKEGQAIISFDHVGGGLQSDGDELKGFAIAGPDKRFVWAKAAIQGSTVIVSSTEVTAPVAVRFGWSDFPVVNLYNKEGLPASPFRTDDFPMITAPKN